MKIEQFTYSPDTLARELTSQSHQVVYWLNRNGYLDNEDTVELLERMVVVPIKNEKSFGQRILARFFDKSSDETTYVFPITMLEENNQQSTDTNKPTLTVVK